jgi:hypothetical protein
MNAKAIGLQHVKLLAHKEHFTMKSPDTHILNIMIGTMNIQHVGEMTVNNHSTGEVTIIKFFAEGWSGNDKYKIEGYVYGNAAEAKKGKANTQRMKMWGKWTESIMCVPM